VPTLKSDPQLHDTVCYGRLVDDPTLSDTLCPGGALATKPEPLRLLTTQELADYLGFSPEKLKSMRRRDQGPPWIRVSPREIRYELAAVNAWLIANTRGSDDIGQA